MVNNRWLKKVNTMVEKNKSYLCIGLDTDYEKLPLNLKKSNRSKSMFNFNKAIIDSTKDLVCCYKLNSAFYEAEGWEGIKILQKTVKYIGNEMPIIIDAKRGDIGNSSKMYGKFIFDYLGADAGTVLPYMGYDSIEPFIEYRDRYIFVVVLSSNSGAKDFQYYSSNNRPLYLEVIEKIKDKDNVGFVFGATKPEEIKRIREQGINNMLLIPGLGSQGGDIEKSVKYSFMKGGKAIFNVSRSIIYAGNDKKFSKEVREVAKKYRDNLMKFIF